MFYTKNGIKINFTNFFTPKSIKIELDKYLIGQHETKKIVSVAIYNHYKKLFLLNKKNIVLDKSNIILIGPTGSGKTMMVKTLSKVINIPIIIVDATSFTEAGYVGDDVESIIQKLLHECNYNVELTERSIVYIDEIDKLSKKSDYYSGKDISGEGVQQSLLKIIEGTIINVTSIVEKKNVQQIFNIDTTNILFIVGGAFSGIENIIKNRVNLEKNFINKLSNNLNIIKYTSTEDLMEFGLIPEFLGRIPILAKFKELNELEFLFILIKSKNSLLKQFCYLFIIEGVELKFSFKALKSICNIAIKKKIGARGLKTILENVLLNTMYHFPSKKNLKFIFIHNNVVKENKKPIFIYK